MSEKIVQLNEAVIKSELKELVRGSVEETLNELLEAEAEKLTQAARYERNEQRQGYRSGHYSRNLTTTSGDVTLKVPKLKGISFETAIIERYRRRERSVEEALIEMYLAGVSVRRVEDITEALWGSKVSPSTISELNKKAYVHIEDWRNRPLQGGRYPYVYVDGIYLRRNWGGEFENVAILVAIAVNEDGYREVLGAAEGMKEDKASWVSFFQWLRGRGLDGVKLVVGDKCLGMLEAVGEVFPEAKYQRCTVHFYRNVFSVTPRSKVMLAKRGLIEDDAIQNAAVRKADKEKRRNMHHNTLLLLRSYRDIRWMLQCFPDTIAEELDAPLHDLDTLLDLVNAEIDLDNYRLENRIQSMRLSRSMMDRLNEAVSILRDKPQNGDMLYNIIYLTYIAPERLTVVEICSKLHISDRQYYRLRQQALNMISIRLWSAPAAELDSWIEVMSLLEVL